MARFKHGLMVLNSSAQIIAKPKFDARRASRAFFVLRFLQRSRGSVACDGVCTGLFLST
jgi:hypothetical protein